MGGSGKGNVKNVILSKKYLILIFLSDGVGYPHVMEELGEECLSEVLHELDFEVLREHGKGGDVYLLEEWLGL